MTAIALFSAADPSNIKLPGIAMALVGLLSFKTPRASVVVPLKELLCAPEISNGRPSVASMRSEPLPVMKPLKRALPLPETIVNGKSPVAAVTEHSPSGSLKAVAALSTAMLPAPILRFGSSMTPDTVTRLTSPTIT